MNFPLIHVHSQCRRKIFHFSLERSAIYTESMKMRIYKLEYIDSINTIAFELIFNSWIRNLTEQQLKVQVKKKIEEEKVQIKIVNLKVLRESSRKSSK